MKFIAVGIIKNMKSNKTQIKLEIDYDTMDGLVRASLENSIETLEETITSLKRIKKPTTINKQDLGDAVLDLMAFEKVYNYYGGNEK
jgi:hypothetical protein